MLVMFTSHTKQQTSVLLSGQDREIFLPKQPYRCPEAQSQPLLRAEKFLCSRHPAGSSPRACICDQEII